MVYVGSAGYDSDWVDQLLAIPCGSMRIPFQWPSKNGALPLCRGLLARLQGTVSASLGFGLEEGGGNHSGRGACRGVRGAWTKRSSGKRELEVGSRVPRLRAGINTGEPCTLFLCVETVQRRVGLEKAGTCAVNCFRPFAG